MANTLDMVSLVWRVLQLSPKPFGNAISSFIGPGSNTEITKSMEQLRSLKSRNTSFFVELKSCYRSSLPLEPFLRHSNSPPPPEKTADTLSSSVPFNISIPSTLDLAVTLVFSCFPTTFLYAGNILFFIIVTTVSIWTPP